MASRTTLLARLETRQAQLAAAEASYTGLLAEKAKSFSVGTSEGTHTVDKRGLAEIKKQIDTLTAEIDLIEAQLNGRGGIVRLGVMP